MRALALIVLYGCATYLVLLGLVALIDPRRALGFLRKFAQTRRANAIEASCRIAAGLAFTNVAPDLPASDVILGFALVLIVSAVAMLALPDLHRRFADRVVPGIARFVPLVGIVSLAMGGVLALMLRPLTALLFSPY